MRRVESIVGSTKKGGASFMRLYLECDHVAYRRDNGTRPIWAICERCGTAAKLED